MNTQIQQIRAEGQLDPALCRNCMLLTILSKLFMALVLGVLIVLTS